MSAKTPDSLPRIPGCTVTLGPNGLMRVTHNTTGDTLTADTVERVDIAGAILRITATWHSTPREIPFQTGNPS